MEQKELEEFYSLLDREYIERSDIGTFSSDLINNYLKALLTHKSDPEASVSEIIRSLFTNLSPQATAGPGSIDFIEDTVDNGKIGIEIKKYLEYDTKRKVITPNEINPYINTKKSLALKDQIYKYCKGDFDYIILTNLKKWYFYDPISCTTRRKTKPFAELSFNDLNRNFNTGFTINKIRRIQSESSKIDMGDDFFEDLTTWVNELKPIFTNTLKGESLLEYVILILNKFIFIRTLEANQVVPYDFIGREWKSLNEKYPDRPKIFLINFFQSIDSFFKYYYDTDIFDPIRTEAFLNNINEEKNNWAKFKEKLAIILGIDSNDTGIRNYRFEQLDIDIFGGTYERFLAEQRNIRKVRGIYYTPEYVSDYIVFSTFEQTLSERINNIIKIVDNGVDDNQINDCISSLKDFKVCDIACGSGSFLTQAFIYIWEKYIDLDDYLSDRLKSLKENHIGQKTLTGSDNKIEKRINYIIEKTELSNKLSLVAHILLNHIYGNDLDKRATEVAKLNIWLEVIKTYPELFKWDVLPNSVSYVLPNLSLNIAVGDSVIGLDIKESIELISTNYGNKIRLMDELKQKYIKNPDNLELIQQVIEIRDEISKELVDRISIKDMPYQPIYHTLFFWPAYFNPDGTSRKNPGFDVIVGNPPYGQEQLDAIRKVMHYRSVNDTYSVFIERALDLVNKGGRLGYIVPTSWQTAVDFNKFRSYIIKDYFVENVVNLPFDTFKDAYVDCGIVVIKNEKN